MHPNRGHVYVITASNGLVKIGSTGRYPYNRLAAIAGCSPLPLTFSYVCECLNFRNVERAVHISFYKYRSHLEWFNLSTEQAIEAVRDEVRLRGRTNFIVQPERTGQRGKKVQHTAKLFEIAAISY
jgi:hypothetical protein